MSTTSDFVKRPDGEFSLQLNTFSTKLDTLGAGLGISPAQIAGAKADAALFAYVNTGQQTTKDFSKGWTTYKNDLRSNPNGDTQDIPVINLPTSPATTENGIEARFRALAGQIKSSPNYTDAIGVQLGIVGTESAGPSATEAQPRILGLSVTGGTVLLRWQKGSFDGINIYKKKDNGSYTQVGVDTKPDWNDKQGLPPTSETWTYKIIYFIDDSEVGLFSDEATINVGG
ncbi:MAG: hypothetical protein ACRC2M_25560 [Planktothrix sp.]